MNDDNLIPRAPLLGDHIQAGHAKVKAALPHADDNVARPLEQRPQPRQGGNTPLILARIGLVDAQPASRQKLHRLYLQPPLRRQSQSYIAPHNSPF
jgi:hypothetical protein